MNDATPILVVAGTSSGVGKTSATLGLARAYRRRGLKVQTFKVGPDYLDPTYLTLAAGRPCYNLDSWMTSPEYVRSLAGKLGTDADLCLVEGVMGLYDGSAPDALSGSTAEIALTLGAPVLLVCNAHGAARSLAAMVKGYAEFEPEVRVGGVLANRVGSERHVAWLASALRAARLPGLLGAIPRDALPELQSRHLGLVSARSDTVDDATFEALADAVESHVDLDALLDMAAAAAAPKASGDTGQPAATVARVGVARDEAFHFYYPDNLDMLRDAGAELVYFSPLHDNALPQELDGLILGGGYPEEFGPTLTANDTMRHDVKRFAASGRPVYGECGGLMYLGQELIDRSGQPHAMCDVLPLSARMLPKLKTLGYVDSTFAQDCCLGPAGLRARGHEFHYSEIANADDDRQRPFLSRRPGGERETPRGFARDNTLASYIHLHFASAPEVPQNFVRACVEARRGLEDSGQPGSTSR